MKILKHIQGVYAEKFSQSRSPNLEIAVERVLCSRSNQMAKWLIEFIVNYGYSAIFIGSIIEGETVLVLGGLAAHQGYLSIYYVFLFSFFGAMVGDFGWFLMGRMWGERLLARFPRFKKWTNKMMVAIHKRPGTLSFLLRFLYGLRHIVPFSIGMSKIAPQRFFALNAAGAVVWGVILVGVGYSLGLALESMLGRLRKIEFMLVVLILLIAFGLKGFIHLSRYVGEKLGFNGDRESL